MILVLYRDWQVTDGATRRPATVPAGEHKVERVRNPLGHAAPWLVLKGTLVGATEGFWRQWQDDDSDYRVRIVHEIDPAPRVVHDSDSPLAPIRRVR